MRDLEAFERLVASEVAAEGGHARPVDDLAIFEAATTTSLRWRFQPMFGATKVAVAGALVALFGGLFLAGVLTQPSDEAVTGSPGLTGVDLVTEEVEPGVYRVLSDGVRDLGRSGSDGRPAPKHGQVVVGLDGSVWILERDGFFRIGDEATHRWESDEQEFDSGDVAVGPDGTLWRVGPPQSSEDGAGVRAQLRSFDGRGWDLHDLQVPGFGGPREIVTVDEVEVTADGVLWVAWDGGRECFGRLNGDSWEVVEAPGGCTISEISQLGGLWEGDTGVRILDGDVWRTAPYPSGLETAYAMTAVGPDGTAWMQVPAPEYRYDTLGRFDGTEWQLFDERDGVPRRWAPKGGDPWLLGVAPDGSAWYPADEVEVGCSLARFDGRTATRFLSGYCVTDLDIAPDGAVWLRAVLMDTAGKDPSAESDVVHTYVITPEAAAAAG